MDNDDNLNHCFSRLENRVFELKLGKGIKNQTLSTNISSSNIVGDILRFDPEISLRHVEYHSSLVTNLIKELPEIVKKSEEFVDDIKNPFTPEVTSFKTATEKRKEYLAAVNRELDSYLNELKSLNDHLKKKIAEISSEGPPNAGFKLNLKLDGKSIGTLFHTLYELKLIDFDGDIENEKARKENLCKFISCNISAGAKKEFLSKSHLYKNCMNFNGSVEILDLTRKIKRRITNSKS